MGYQPKIETIDHQSRARASAVGHRLQSDHDGRCGAIFGQGAAVVHQGDELAAPAKKAAQAIAAKLSVGLRRRVRPLR